MPVITYFGVPGSGKTTHAAKIVKKNLKNGIITYSNVVIRGAVLINVSDIGRIQLENADLIIDEASIEYNNRNYKNLPKEQIKWFKLYRHYGIRNIHIYSQSYDDMDITLRRLSDVLFLTKKTIIPGLFITRQISRKIGINKETHQIEDQYFFQFLKFSFTFGPRYWSMFDSWNAPRLPQKKLQITGYEGYPPDGEVAKLIYSNMKIRRKKDRKNGKKDD